MRVLLDTHVLVWWLQRSPLLSRKAERVMRDARNELLWSAASTWELALKSARGRIQLPVSLPELLKDVFESEALTPLPIEHAHAAAVATLQPRHRDPFDRMLVAQARIERVALLTSDRTIPRYGVEIVW